MWSEVISTIPILMIWLIDLGILSFKNLSKLLHMINATR